jgi:hypothetical protein
LHLEIREIKEEYVSIFVREDETTCELKEMESVRHKKGGSGYTSKRRFIM